MIKINKKLNAEINNLIKFLERETLIKPADKNKINELKNTFNYEVPEELQNEIEMGQWVKVPFGAKNSTVDGFVLSIKEDEIIDSSFSFIRQFHRLKF